MAVMDEKQIRYTISGRRQLELKIKRSNFICSLEPVTSIDQAKGFIREISRENQQATHNCWAYIIGDSGQMFHSSDAGEPPGTAGKPMLNRLKKNSMTQIAAVVTRYFGGVKLGVKGLMDAYSTCVQQTLDMKKLKPLIKTIGLEIQVSYEFNDILLNQIDAGLMGITQTQYSDVVTHTLEIIQAQEAVVADLLAGYQAEGKLEFRYL